MRPVYIDIEVDGRVCMIYERSIKFTDVDGWVIYEGSNQIHRGYDQL